MKPLNQLQPQPVWPATPEEGEIIEPDALSYQFCVPPDDTHTTDTNTTVTTAAEPAEPPLKRQRMCADAHALNMYPTLTLHSNANINSSNGALSRSRSRSRSKSQSPIYYYTQNHNNNNRNHGYKIKTNTKARRCRRHHRNRGHYHRHHYHRPRYHSRSRSHSHSPRRRRYSSKHFKSKANINETQQNHNNIQQYTDIEILKQKAMESVQRKREQLQLNSSALLKDDLFDERYDTFDVDSCCKSIVMKIVKNVTANEDEVQRLALLRALALKSLPVDMEISDISDHEADNHENDEMLQKQEELQRLEMLQKQEEIQRLEIEKRRKEVEMNTFLIESQKLSLILAQIRQKTQEKSELMRMAFLAAQELHTFIDKFELAPADLHHEQLNDLINSHFGCANCKINDVRKTVQKIAKKKKKKKKKRGNEIKLLNETINDLNIDYNCNIYDINLYDAYQNMTQYDAIKNKALITAKIESNLLLYYQDHLGSVEKYHEKTWSNLDVMREYTLDELPLLQ